MEPANNYIDDLVRNAFPQEDTRSGDAALWDRIDKTLRFKGFLRFSLSHFNIYYSVFIIIAITSATYLVMNNNHSKYTPPVKNNNTQIVPAVMDSTPAEQKDNNAIESSVSSSQNANMPATGTSGGHNIQSQVSGTFDANSGPVATKNSEKPASAATDNMLKKQKKVKVIKTQVVVTDTVRKRDTVYKKITSSPK
jgi:hypothetical protein